MAAIWDHDVFSMTIYITYMFFPFPPRSDIGLSRKIDFELLRLSFFLIPFQDVPLPKHKKKIATTENAEYILTEPCIASVIIIT